MKRGPFYYPEILNILFVRLPKSIFPELAPDISWQ